jgi:hypothetical protein
MRLRLRWRRRLLRFRTWTVGALTVAMVAAPLALSAGAASASTGVPASGVTWHRITGINGWHSAESRYSTGNPSWAVSGGVVYLSGSIIRSGGTSALFGVLPSQARPSHKLWITVYTLDDTTGTLTIYPSGQMYASSTPPGNAPGFTSLAAVSFPAKSSAHTTLTLLNGWHSEQSAFKSGNPSYTVKGGVVYLSGSLATSGTSDQFAVLPRAARPAHVEYITVYTFAGTHGTLELDPNGKAFAYAGSTTSFTSLAGVSYPVASAVRHKLTLRNGWHSEQSVWNSGDPAYSVSGGVVYLSGSLATPGTNEAFAVLPTAARPAHDLYIKVYTLDSSVGTVLIEPNGVMFAYGPGAVNARKFTSLASISFPLKS